VKWFFLITGIGAGPAAMFLTEVAGSPTSDSVPWLTGGAVFALAGAIWKLQRDRINSQQNRIDSLEAELKERYQQERSDVIPAVLKNSAVVEQNSQVLERVIKTLDELSGLVRGQSGQND
jgi:hypothetical protein